MSERTIESAVAPEGCPIQSQPSLSATADAHGISPRMLAVLTCAAATPGLPGKEVARRMGLTRGHVYKATVSLCEMGLTQAKADPADMRHIKIFPTPAGAELLRRIAASLAPPSSVPPSSAGTSLLTSRVT